jgi:hypothetical protein
VRLTLCNPLPINRTVSRIVVDPSMRCGGVSRAAKGADCKSDRFTFIIKGFSETSHKFGASPPNRLARASECVGPSVAAGAGVGGSAISKQYKHCESAIQRAVGDARGIWYFCVPSTRTAAGARVQRQRFWGSGVRAGMPDVIAVKAGRTYALELKPLLGGSRQRSASCLQPCARRVPACQWPTVWMRRSYSLRHRSCCASRRHGTWPQSSQPALTSLLAPFSIWTLRPCGGAAPSLEGGTVL